MNVLIVLKMLKWLMQGWRFLGASLIFLKMAWVIKGSNTNRSLRLVLVFENHLMSSLWGQNGACLAFFYTHSTWNAEGSKTSEYFPLLARLIDLDVSMSIAFFLEGGVKVSILAFSHLENSCRPWIGFGMVFVISKFSFPFCVFLLNVYLCVIYTREVFLSSL